MRVIDVFDEPVRAVAVSPDGRFLAAAAGFNGAIVDWLSGEVVREFGCNVPLTQLAFTADGNWAIYAATGGMLRLLTGPGEPYTLHRENFSGGVAISPDAKTLVATRAGHRGEVKLERWELPGLRPATGFDFWSPFQKLAFSPNGEFLAGIDADSFELRIAVTGGLNGRHRVHYINDGFFTFPRDSQTVVFGWETDLHVMETRAGNIVKRVPSPGHAFRDAAFLATGHQLATVDGSEVMRVWSADSWEVARAFDWNAGELACLAVTADGLTGVCGTENGQLVVFDVDE